MNTAKSRENKYRTKILSSSLAEIGVETALDVAITIARLYFIL
ncbi:MAG: hypothetical protein QXE66_03470 [Desulfurococcaceae archaeon]